MNNEILINVSPLETRAALIENGLLQDIMIERGQNRGLVGNIYYGKVVRVLPGLQAAFVDVGLERACFLHIDDVKKTDKQNKIDEVLKEGQWICVQISKDPIGQKGARISMFLSLPSRFLVFMPDLAATAVSQRIDDADERERLKNTVQLIKQEQFAQLAGNFIVRTVADGAGQEDFLQDMLYLQKLWQTIQEKIKQKKEFSCLYQDLPLSLSILRDRVRADVERIRVDSVGVLQEMQAFSQQFLPHSRCQLEHYSGERPILELYGIENEIQQALNKTVSLKSGGYLVIDQNEAMSTIDVNTGAYVGHRNLEETILKTNLEAAVALARQLRVRNLAGIIIVDFIDMQDEAHRLQVQQALSQALQNDYARASVSGVTELGLIQIVRKRTHQSLQQILSEPCPSCHGRGMIKSTETVCYEIFRALLRDARTYHDNNYLVVAQAQVVDRLLNEEAENVADLEQLIGKTLSFQIDTQYTQEQFDIILL